MLAYPNPSVLYSYDLCAISFEGNCAIITEISRVNVHNLVVYSYASISKEESSFLN